MYQYNFLLKCMTCVCNTLYNEQMKVLYMNDMHEGLGIGFDTHITSGIEECMLVWV